ncbi:MAG: hypothetical protein QXG01_07960 [Candidatus Bathyarchaeia archaeon]
MEFEEKEFVKDGTTYRLSLLRLENAVIAFFYENNIKLGTLALALPKVGEVSVPRSSVLSGGKFLMVSRILAEKVAASFDKIGLVSIHSSLPEDEVFRIFIKLFDDLLRHSKKFNKRLL